MYTFSLHCLLLTAALVASGLAQCRNGWTRHDNSCYHFSRDAESFVDAMVVCEKIGGELAEMNNARETDYLAREVKVLNLGYWVGATDWEVEGEWQWLTSRATVSVSDTHWKPNEPNNINNEENCLMFTTVGTWNDEHCSTKLRYICEMNAGYAGGGELIG